MRQKLVVRDDLVVDLPKGPIGISFSGGVDSSLLVYLALSQLKTYPVHLFTISVNFRDFAQQFITARVLKKICEITENFNVFHHITVSDDKNVINDIIKTPRDYVLKYNIINSILGGGNANPPVEVFQGTKYFKNGVGPMHDIRNPYVERSIKVSPFVYHPFTNLNKQDIIKIYKDHNIDKSILPLTQSCWTLPVCNKCWFCIERNWGMQVLN